MPRKLLFSGSLDVFGSTGYVKPCECLVEPVISQDLLYGIRLQHQRYFEFFVYMTSLWLLCISGVE